MKANELRIGSYVQTKYDTIFIVNLLPEQYDECYNNIESIPLTEEWLLKFNLKRQISIFEIFGDNQRGFHIDLGGEWLFIKHVHQLQNLYFALTGEELEIK